MSGHASARFTLLALLLVALVVRLPGITRPLVGPFATKNAVYGMIARNWARGGEAWHPTLDCLKGGQRAWHLTEFPVAAYVAGSLWKFGGPLDAWGRGLSIACSLAAVALMFRLVARWHGTAAAAGAAAMLALSPVSMIYGQSFLLEPSVVCLSLAMLLALDCWAVDKRWWQLGLAGVSFALLLLTKIYMLVLAGAIVAVLRRRAGASGSEHGAGPAPRTSREAAAAVGVLLLAALPAALWYADAYRLGLPDSPQSSRVFYSVSQSAAVHRPPHPLLASPDFYRQMLDDLAGCVLTPLGLALALVGLAHPGWKRHLLWLAGMGLLVVLLPLKFYEMNYYWLVALPPLCVLVGLGWERVHERLGLEWRGKVLVLGAGLLLALRHAVGPAFVTPEEDRGVVAAAAAVRKLAGESEPVVTMHGSTLDLLYYCDRAGWAIPPSEHRLDERLAECRAEGARLLVVANLASLREHPAAAAVVARLPRLAAGDDFAVYRLDTETERRGEGETGRGRDGERERRGDRDRLPARFLILQFPSPQAEGVASPVGRF